MKAEFAYSTALELARGSPVEIAVLRDLERIAPLAEEERQHEMLARSSTAGEIVMAGADSQQGYSVASEEWVAETSPSSPPAKREGMTLSWIGVLLLISMAVRAITGVGSKDREVDRWNPADHLGVPRESLATDPLAETLIRLKEMPPPTTASPSLHGPTTTHTFGEVNRE